MLSRALLSFVLAAGALPVCVCAEPIGGVRKAITDACRFELQGTHGYREGNTVLLWEARAVPVRMLPETVAQGPPVTFQGTTYVSDDARVAWALASAEDRKGEQVLRKYGAFEPARLKPLGNEAYRLLEPGTLGGRMVLDATFSAVYRPQGASSGTAGIPVQTTARLVFVAPMVVPANKRYDALVDLGLGRYLNPRHKKKGASPTKPPTLAALHPDAYQPPDLLYHYGPLTRDVKVSEHFQLGLFAMDYPWFSFGNRQYLALDPHLVDKLEALLALLREKGYARKGFTFIYAFRPPVFNRQELKIDKPQVNLKQPFSMHQYGRAVDLIVDDDGDLKMDDLNGDGKIDVFDAGVVLHYVNQLDEAYKQTRDPRGGGAGIYASHDFVQRPVQSPYIHIDTRAYLNGNQYSRWTEPAALAYQGRPVNPRRIDERGFPIQ